jgi:hypothetical protein
VFKRREIDMYLLILATCAPLGGYGGFEQKTLKQRVEFGSQHDLVAKNGECCMANKQWLVT